MTESDSSSSGFEMFHDGSRAGYVGRFPAWWQCRRLTVRAAGPRAAWEETDMKVILKKAGVTCMALIEIKDMYKIYRMGSEKVHALDGVEPKN